MKIHILTGHFHPQIHPRAFRSHELAAELVRQGHTVTVTNLTTIEGFDYEQYTREYGVRVENMELYKETADNSRSGMSKTGQSFIGHAYRFLLTYLLDGALFIKGRQIADRLKIEADTDLVVALSTPFMCLYGLSLYIRKHKPSFVAIADSGDPFYYSRQNKRAPWFALLERRVYSSFHYLTIPTANAIPSYERLIPREKIRIIPQGFRMDHLKLCREEPTGIPRFAYAGVFYWDIRNPEFLFQYLDKLNIPYEFHLFMRYRDALVDQLLGNYPNVEEKVVMHFSVPHDELLYQLSTMHFLVNIENVSNTQMPSKLIDYGMSGRPVLSCRKDNFSQEVFNSFMEGNYEGAMEIDVRDYDISLLARKFVDMAKVKP